MGRELAGIEYAGVAGDTESCVKAVVRYIQCRDNVTTAKVLTEGTSHCLLLSLAGIDPVAVKAGFASGYIGEGSRGFSFVLQLLKAHDVEIEEIIVPPELIQRLNMSALTRADLRLINDADPVMPTRWYDYIFERHYDRKNEGTLWREFPPLVPFSIIDPRIIDLAITFWDSPDERLLSAYRRLEDTIRERTGVDEHGSKLCSAAFLPPPGRLFWPGVNTGEHSGRANLFIGAFGAYRNPRAHRELKESSENQLAEFLLVNQLYRLEREACVRVPPKEGPKAGLAAADSHGRRE